MNPTAKPLPPGWTLKRLDDFAETSSGGTPSRGRAAFYGGAIPWVKSGELPDGLVRATDETITELGLQSSSAKLFPKGTLCIALYGATVGKLGILDMEAATNQAVCGIFLPPDIDAKYLYWFLRLSRPALIEQGKGGAQPNISQQIVRSIEVPLAPPEKRTAILAEIEKQSSRIDAGVAALKRVQANLKRYRASVLRAACDGRLVPTEAELARRESRDYEPASVLLQRILKEHRRHWEASELAKLKAKGKPPADDRWKAKYKVPAAPDTSARAALPEGWCWASWAQVGFSQNGRGFPSSEYCEVGTKLLRPGNLHMSGRVEWTEKNTRCMPTTWEEEAKDLLIGPGELVMNLTAQSLKDEFLGRVCLTGPDECCLLNQRLARLTCVLVDTKYVLYLFKSWDFRRFVDGLNSGSLIQHMFTSQLDDFVFGDSALYDSALNALVAASTAEVCIYHCDGTKRQDGEGELGWALLLRGLDMPEEQLMALLETTRAGHEDIPDLMAQFFGDLLERCGVEIENRMEQAPREKAGR